MCKKMGPVETLSNLSCRLDNTNILVTLPGLRPAAVATPVGIENNLLNLRNFLKMPQMDPANEYLIEGEAGRGLNPLLSKYSFFFKIYKGFNKTKKIGKNSGGF
jgi:hypothetical protein